MIASTHTMQPNNHNMQNLLNMQKPTQRKHNMKYVHNVHAMNNLQIIIHIMCKASAHNAQKSA